MKATQKGFTLIELMITLVVLGVLLSFGVPSFTAWIQDSRVDGAAQNFATVLKLARSEAVARQQGVTLNWTDWNDSDKGIELYTDSTAGGNSAYDAADQYIKQGMSVASDGVTITTSDANSYISFNPNGTLNEAGAITIAVCDSRGEAQGWDIDINIVGRVTLTQPSADCSL